MSWRGVTVTGTALAACLELGVGVRAIARAAEVSERMLGRMVRRGVRARLRRSVDDVPELLAPLIDVHAAMVASCASRRGLCATQDAAEAWGRVVAWGWDLGPLRAFWGGLWRISNG